MQTLPCRICFGKPLLPILDSAWLSVLFLYVSCLSLVFLIDLEELGQGPAKSTTSYQRLPLSHLSRFTNRIALSSSANASWISSANKRYPSSLTLSLSLSSVFVSLSILLSRVIPLASRPSDPPSHQRYYSRAHQAHHGSCFFVISFSLHFSSPAWHLMRYNDKVLYRNPPAIIRPTKI